jgi:DNA invertase Pin-like site-specific DNA recombinase
MTKKKPTARSYARLSEADQDEVTRKQPEPGPTAYSYIRFSSKRQEAGDSINRQDTGAKEWAARNNVPLDTSLKIDKGISAFKGQNADLGSLGEFLKRIERGRVRRGDYLIVESLDRLTREDIQPALRLILAILAAGIRIVQLTPVEMVYDNKSDVTALIIMIVELSRGHSESKTKSERVGKAWREKRRRAQAGEEQNPTARMGNSSRVMTRRLPAWVEAKDGQPVLIPDRAAVVGRIFKLAASGYGIPSIIKKFTAEGVPCFGGRARNGGWTRSYIGIILKDRRALGELQPKEGGVAAGPPIPDYYPAVVTEEEFNAARGGAEQRRTNPGRLGSSRINLFAGLLKHARDGDGYMMVPRLSKTNGRLNRKFQVLINSHADQGAGRCYSFPYDLFEEAILTHLKEINPHDILNGDHAPDEVMALAGEFATVETELAEATAFMEANGFSPTIGKRITALEARKDELADRLRVARQKAEHPLSETWGEAQSLMASLKAATDQEDARLRLRSALRSMAECIMLLVVPQGQQRLAAVQIWFAGGRRCRTYLLLYSPAHKNAQSDYRPAVCWPCSTVGIVTEGKLDLRKPDHAARLEKALLALDLSSLRDRMLTGRRES